MERFAATTQGYIILTPSKEVRQSGFFKCLGFENLNAFIHAYTSACKKHGRMGLHDFVELQGQVEGDAPTIGALPRDPLVPTELFAFLESLDRDTLRSTLSSWGMDLADLSKLKSQQTLKNAVRIWPKEVTPRCRPLFSIVTELRRMDESASRDDARSSADDSSESDDDTNDFDESFLTHFQVSAKKPDRESLATLVKFVRDHNLHLGKFTPRSQMIRPTNVTVRFWHDRVDIFFCTKRTFDVSHTSRFWDVVEGIWHAYPCLAVSWAFFIREPINHDDYISTPYKYKTGDPEWSAHGKMRLTIDRKLHENRTRYVSEDLPVECITFWLANQNYMRRIRLTMHEFLGSRAMSFRRQGVEPTAAQLLDKDYYALASQLAPSEEDKEGKIVNDALYIYAISCIEHVWPAANKIADAWKTRKWRWQRIKAGLRMLAVIEQVAAFGMSPPDPSVRLLANGGPRYLEGLAAFEAE